MKYTKYLTTLLLTLSIILIVQISFLSAQKSNKTQIKSFINISNSYNLALSNETIGIRYRYESCINDHFGLSPTSREYFSSTFVYAPSDLLRDVR
jgi:hypothetical protein